MTSATRRRAQRDDKNIYRADPATLAARESAKRLSDARAHRKKSRNFTR